MDKNILKERIVAKSAVIEDQLQSKIINFDKFEIQLLGNEDLSDKGCEKIVNMFVRNNAKAVGVHCALINYDTCRLYDVLYKTDRFEMAKGAIKLANKFSELYNEEIYVVMHGYFSSKELENKILYNNICKNLNELKNGYNNIKICIENVTPVGFYENYYYGINGLYMKDCIIKDGNYGTIFDICHFQTTKILYNDITNWKQNELEPTYESEIAYAGKTLNGLHINFATEKGMTETTHGLASRNIEERMNILRRVIKSLVDNELSPYLILEVREKDYTNPINAISQKEDIFKIIDEI